MSQVITITGNLTADPELRFTPNGTAVCSLRVAVNTRYKDERGEWQEGEATFYKVSCWRQLAENVAETFTKGQTITVTGKPKLEQWVSKEGVPRAMMSITADSASVDLRWQVAKISRSQSKGTHGTSQQGAYPTQMGGEEEPPF